MKEKQCRRCGKTFMPLAAAQVYCTKECAKEAHREVNRERSRADYKPAQPKEHTCKICGTKFLAKNPRSCYCSPECRKIGLKRCMMEYEGRRATYRAAYREAGGTIAAAPKRQQRTATNGMRICVLCGNAFIPRNYARGQKYCSVACADEAAKWKRKVRWQNTKAERDERPMDKITEDPFAYRETELEKAAQRKSREEHRKHLESEIKAASASGMSYGNYVALMSIERFARIDVAAILKEIQR